MMRSAFVWLALGLGINGPLSMADEPSPAPEPDATGGGSGSFAARGWMARTLPEIAAALRSGEVGSEALTAAYIARIEAIDRAGPELQSVLSLNPRAIEDARAADTRRAAGEPLGSLHGVPILLKDNIESLDPVPTTAGSLALKDNVTGRDSPLVAGLRAEGAIILGKTNLSEWANFRSNDSMSGWSALGGQVRNPHMLDRNPCGSSSGSAVAVAASLAAGAVGTETNGSIICPATMNGIVGFKPTVGLVSQRHIVPISSSQDTAGPMTKTVAGTALMLNAMVTGEKNTDFVAALDSKALEGARIGVMRFAQGAHAGVRQLFDQALSDMAAAGAELIEIDSFEPATTNFWGKALDVLRHEFKATIDAYLAEAPPAVPVRSLDDLIAFNDAHAEIELALFDQGIFLESAKTGGLDSPGYLAALADVQAAAGENGIDRLLAEHRVDILVAPSGPVASRIDPIYGDVWPGWAGAGYLAAVAGYPHLSVPMGAVRGLPAGVSFIGGRHRDAEVLAVGYAFEQRTMSRVEPGFLPGAEARPDVAPAMRRRADLLR